MTVDVSCTLPTLSAILTLTGVLSPTRISRVTRVNPVSATFSVARPTGTMANVNLPCASVTVDRGTAPAVVSVTVAPGITAPLVSTTMPLTICTVAAVVGVCTRIAATRQPSNMARMWDLQAGADERPVSERCNRNAGSGATKCPVSEGLDTACADSAGCDPAECRCDLNI